MDLEQKFIGDSRFGVEEWFATSILRISSKARESIIEDIVSVMPKLPTDGWEQKIYGVVDGEDIFYEVHYLKEEDEFPLLIDLRYVGVDEFLDALLEKNTVKSF